MDAQGGRRRNIGSAKRGFGVLQTGRAVQTAVMTLAPGEASGDYGNEHPKSEQVLLVLEGRLVAEIGGRRHTMKQGDVVVVPRAVPHRFRNASSRRAVTFSVYAPPAY
jgi:mannose-6-phosphate isomerase-like protein (cupin superfamily)